MPVARELECLACTGRVLCVTPDCPDPRPGDLAFCDRCGAMHAFTDDMQLRYPVDDDLRQLFRRARDTGAGTFGLPTRPRGKS